jgi:hypothetical protein
MAEDSDRHLKIDSEVFNAYAANYGSDPNDPLHAIPTELENSTVRT